MNCPKISTDFCFHENFVTKLFIKLTSHLIILVSENEEEMQLLPEPLFTLSTDSTHMLCVKGTSSGRVFLGGKDGSLYEYDRQSPIVFIGGVPRSGTT